MESKEQQQPKYSYRYVLKAPGAGAPTSKEPDKNELLDYINEVLGIDRPKNKETVRLTV